VDLSLHCVVLSFHVVDLSLHGVVLSLHGVVLSLHDVVLSLHGVVSDKISQQPENCENRNDPDLVQAFLKKWWVESDFKAPNLPLSLRFKGSQCKEKR
jgi:hypothetical protein